jgi:signal peptidase II
MINLNNSKFWCVAIIVAIILFDLATKLLIVEILNLHEVIPVLPFFDILLVYNKGAAFSFLADAGGWQRIFLPAVSFIISAILFVWLWRSNNRHLFVVALSLIIGGAIGNGIDRVTQGQVVDFIGFHYNHYYFPPFNLADISISCGAGLLLLEAFLARKKTDKQG